MFLRSELKKTVRSLFGGARQCREVEVRQIEMAFHASTKNLGAGIIAVFLLCLGIWGIPRQGGDRASLPYLVAWALALVFFLIRGMFLSNRFRRRPADDDEVIRQGRRLADNGVAAGCLWGASSVFILDSSDIYQATFLVCVIGLVIMGGAGAQAQYGRLVKGFVVSTTAVFVCGVFASPILSPLIGLGFILYGVVALGFAHQQQLSVEQIIRLNVENERLLRQTRESLRELEKARAVVENASRAKTRFLAATGHDLRQPMHALSLYVSHLRQCRDPRETADTLDKADAAMSAMKDLLDAVLDLSRISLGTIRPEPQAVVLGDIIERVRVQLQPQAQGKGLVLAVDHWQGRVWTDPVLLERILRNLVLNAIRYTPSGSVAVRVRERAGKVVLRVADSGIGIARSERERIFEEFYQVDNPERDRQKGLGLGLAIVAQLGELLAHPVSFRSRVGRGSVFRMALEPAVLAAASTSPVNDADESDFVTGCAVLVVDDDALVLDSMRRVLQDMGCHVIVAGSTLDALDKLGGEARIPDLIVSDYRLKGSETGIATIRTLRENIQGADEEMLALPGLIITGDTSPSELAAMLGEGFVVLHKPVAPAVLRAKMNELLAGYSAQLCAAINRKA